MTCSSPAGRPRLGRELEFPVSSLRDTDVSVLRFSTSVVLFRNSHTGKVVDSRAPGTFSAGLPFPRSTIVWGEIRGYRL